MKNGKLIAISAITSALSIIFLLIGVYFEPFDLSCLFTASLLLMIPLCKNSYKSGFLTYGAVTLLSAIFSFGRFSVPILYFLFFGLHPIINYLQSRGGKKLFFLHFVKWIWFLGVLFLMYYIFKIFLFENQFLTDFAPLIIIIGGSLVYLIYDYIMRRFQKLFKILLERLKI